MQYDLVLNGWELGGGTIRIHQRDLLERSFALQGQTLEGMRAKFGAILDAFEYGAPPHGGIAVGIDRWAALLTHQTNIREVMAFPKTQSGSDLMLDAPSPPDPGSSPSSASGSWPRPLDRVDRGRAGLARRAPWLGCSLSRGCSRCSGRGCLAFSGILYRSRSPRPRPATVFRALYALPFLIVLALPEDRRLGPTPRSRPVAGAGAGLFFAVDLTSFHQPSGRSGPGWPRSWATSR